MSAASARPINDLAAFVNSRALATLAWVVAVTIIGLNGWLLTGTFTAWL